MNAAAPYGAAVTIPIACITAAAAVALIACAVYALLAPENTGHRCEPDHVDQLGAWLRRHLRKLRARDADPARPDQPGTAPVDPASGAVPHYRVRRDGVIIQAGGRVTAHTAPRTAPELRDTAAEGIAVIGGDFEYAESFRVPPWSPENSYDGAEVTG